MAVLMIVLGVAWALIPREGGPLPRLPRASAPKLLEPRPARPDGH